MGENLGSYGFIVVLGARYDAKMMPAKILMCAWYFGMDGFAVIPVENAIHCTF